MPRIVIDGTEASWDVSGHTTFRDLMESIYGKVAEGGRVVYRLEVDGRELNPHGEKEMGEILLSEVREVSLTTNSPEELLRNGLDGAITLGDAIRQDIGKSVDAFRRGDGPGGLSYYVACVESMETFFQLSGAILNGFQSGYFTARGAGEPLPPAPSAATAEILTRLLDAQKREDWTVMADILEYEVVPNLTGWTDFLSTLRGDQAK